MALGKSRSNKRSSSSPYTPTILTVVFISISVLVIWILTSKSVQSPQASSRLTATNEDNHSHSPSPPFEDTQGDLPDDVTKPDSDPQTSDRIESTDTSSEVEASPQSQNESVQEQLQRESHESEEESGRTQEPNPNKSSAEEKPNSEEEDDNADNIRRGQENEDKIRRVDVHESNKTDDSVHEKPDESNTSDSFRVGNSVFPKEIGTLALNQTTATVNSTSPEEKSEAFPGGDSSGIPKESKESKKSWSTQAEQSENEKERRRDDGEAGEEGVYGHTWLLCNSSSGPDYIPCLDNEKAISKLRSRKHYEHRERHCPEIPPECLVAVPEGYKKSIEWPKSRDKIWYHNVPNTQLAEVKGHQNWVKVTGEFLTFPGGGTQFIHGALHYIDFIEKSVPNIKWGRQTRVILDVGCGVASLGGYLFERDVLTMSFAPKDEHEAQVQFALERGIPAISAVMGSQRLPFPGRVFDLVHCARCRVPWHVDGGALLLELNRVLRPGGFFVWSATPVYQNLEEDVQIWKEMSALTVSMCWELVSINKDKLNSAGAAMYRKPINNKCYSQRKNNRPPMCKSDDDPNAAWYVPLQACMHRVPEEVGRGSLWPEQWPGRLTAAPYWLNSSQKGIYGKPAPDDFTADYEHWKRVVTNSYMKGLGITWKNVRNIMDMRSVYGGFAAALKEHDVWVMNVVNIDSPDTLPIIYERGLFGIYHDWCESFSTYPRSYDLLHADHLFSKLRKRCKLVPVMAEVDRMVRPGGKMIVRDESNSIGEVENLLKSLHWEVHLTFSKNKEGILSAQKSDWRPKAYAAPA